MPTLPLTAKDLTKEFPRSPRELLAGYVIAARTLDKCRAVLAGTAGEYHFDCPLDNEFLGFTGLSAEAFKAHAATGATDDEMAEPLQLFLEDYIPKVIPKNRPVYVWFDVYDIEEHRI